MKVLSISGTLRKELDALAMQAFSCSSRVMFVMNLVDLIIDLTLVSDVLVITRRAVSN